MGPTVQETCSCGASFASRSSIATKDVKDFRAAHEACRVAPALPQGADLDGNVEQSPDPVSVPRSEVSLVVTDEQVDAAVAAWNMAPDGDPEGAMRAALEASAASAGKDEQQ